MPSTFGTALKVTVFGQSHSEAIGCVVEVNGLEYNLTRINGENPLESYLYVPGVKLTGDVRYYGLETGEIYLERRNITLAVIDAENGAVVLTP